MMSKKVWACCPCLEGKEARCHSHKDEVAYVEQATGRELMISSIRGNLRHEWLACQVLD